VSAAGKFEIVAVASSAGGITALGRVLGALPAGLRVPRAHPSGVTLRRGVRRRLQMAVRGPRYGWK